MGNCKDCRYWEQYNDLYRNRSWTECAAPDWVDPTDKIASNTFAIYTEVNDDTGLIAGLKTGSLFGCVKFEAREDDQILQRL